MACNWAEACFVCWRWRCWRAVVRLSRVERSGVPWLWRTSISDTEGISVCRVLRSVWMALRVVVDDSLVLEEDVVEEAAR